MVMPLGHRTQDPFISGEPGKRLFTAHGVHLWMFLFDLFWVVGLPTSSVFVVGYVKAVDYLGDIQPQVLQISRKWQWPLYHFQIVQMAHIVVRQDFLLSLFSAEASKCCQHPHQND